MRVLRRLQSADGDGGGGLGRSGVLCPRRAGALSDSLPPAVAACLSLAGVAVVDGALLGNGVVATPALARYTEPPTARGVLRALFAPLGRCPLPQSPQQPSSAAARRSSSSSRAAESSESRGGVSSEDAARLEVRFKACPPHARDALRDFLKDPASCGEDAGGSLGTLAGALPADLVPYLQALPIFAVFGASGPHGQPQYHSLRTVHASGSGRSGGGGSRSHSAANSSGSSKWLPPDEDLNDTLLDESFVRAKDGRDRAFLEQLGVKRLSLGQLFSEWLLPRLDADAHHAFATREHEQSVARWQQAVAHGEQAWASAAADADAARRGGGHQSDDPADYPPEPERPPAPRAPERPKPLPPALAREVHNRFF
jgi:hypothetical protein